MGWFVTIKNKKKEEEEEKIIERAKVLAGWVVWNRDDNSEKNDDLCAVSNRLGSTKKKEKKENLHILEVIDHSIHP